MRSFVFSMMGVLITGAVSMTLVACGEDKVEQTQRPDQLHHQIRKQPDPRPSWADVDQRAIELESRVQELEKRLDQRN